MKGVFMTPSEFKDIVSAYVGNLEGTKFSAVNDLIYSHNKINEHNGTSKFVEEHKKVLCVIELNEYGLTAEEETYSILGGVSGTIPSKENIFYYLDKYKFKHKEVEQLSLW